MVKSIYKNEPDELYENSISFWFFSFPLTELEKYQRLSWMTPMSQQILLLKLIVDSVDYRKTAKLCGHQQKESYSLNSTFDRVEYARYLGPFVSLLYINRSISGSREKRF